MLDSEIERFFAQPRYWLMHALPWPTTDPNVGMAEAAHVIAPSTVPSGQRDRLPQDVADLLGYVDVYASEHPDQRVVWFTDVTRWLEWEKGSSWSALGVEWEHALAELARLPLLGLYMTVNRRAYHHLINTAERFRVTYTDGHSEVLTDGERRAVHEAFEHKLDEDWPAYVRDMVASGHLTVG
ncbi:hypothetical protein AMK24_05215 [Streptomyces sp. CB02366]|nr:hypothetical protein AMK24_05215 [Streptomyces sp. CB02366]TVP33574.1 hypothetical protein A3L22_17245 [Streptomyces griseus subsp. griseus]